MFYLLIDSMNPMKSNVVADGKNTQVRANVAGWVHDQRD